MKNVVIKRTQQQPNIKKNTEPILKNKKKYD